MSRTKLKSPKPKTILDFPKIYRDALAHWSTFRNLGFSADDIFFGFGPVSGVPDVVHMQLQAQGKTFTVSIGQLPGEPRERVFKTWQACATMAQTSTVEQRDACYRGHLLGESKDYFQVFVEAIHAKGIVSPEIVRMMPHAGSA